MKLRSCQQGQLSNAGLGDSIPPNRVHALGDWRWVRLQLWDDPLAIFLHVTFAPPRKARIKIQAKRRLLFIHKVGFPPHHPHTPDKTPAASSPVANYSHSSPWPTTRRYVLQHACKWLYPTFSARRCPLRAGITPPKLRSSSTTLTSMYSMSTPSRAPMPVPPRPSPCSALL